MEQLKENKLLDNFTKWVNNKGYIINFESFLEKDKRVLTQKDKGEHYKRISNINALFEEFDRISIIVSKNIMSINPSFLEAYFNDVILKNGRTVFFEKIKFICEGYYDINSDIYEAIERIIRRNKYD